MRCLMKSFSSLMFVAIAITGNGVASAQSTPTWLAFCATANRVMDDAVMRGYSDTQIQNGLCMASKYTVEAVVSEDQAGIALCTEVATRLMKEFKRRFPNANPDTVIGRC